jgi:threonine dehydrogenase-like Zn-dependent dehydrogenase
MADPSISIPAYRLSVDERTVVGSFCYSNSDFRDTADWVASHEDQVSPLVDRAVPLSDGPEIFRQLGDHSIDAHKILLLPSLSQ